MSRRSLPMLQRRAPSYPGMRDGSFADPLESTATPPHATPGWLVFQSVGSVPPRALAPTPPMFPAAADASTRPLEDVDRSVTGWAVREPVGACVTAGAGPDASSRAPAPIATRPPAAPPRVAWMFALALSVVAVGAAMGLALTPKTLHRPTAPAAGSRPTGAAPRAMPAEPPQPTAAALSVRAEPRPTASPASAGAVAATGRLVLPAHARGHRVYVDGKLVAPTGGEVDVVCGARSVRVGSRGKSTSVTVPCGGTAKLR